MTDNTDSPEASMSDALDNARAALARGNNDYGHIEIDAGVLRALIEENEKRMTGHYLAVRHEPYDGDKTYGIFDTLEEARDMLDQADDRSAAVELWVGGNLVESWEWRAQEWMAWAEYRAWLESR